MATYVFVCVRKSVVFIMCLPALFSTLFIEKGSLVELETGDLSNLVSQLNTSTLFLFPEHWDHRKVALPAFIGTGDLNSHFLNNEPPLWALLLLY